MDAQFNQEASEWEIVFKEVFFVFFVPPSAIAETRGPAPNFFRVYSRRATLQMEGDWTPAHLLPFGSDLDTRPSHCRAVSHVVVEKIFPEPGLELSIQLFSFSR